MIDFGSVAACVADRWTPVIGDPSIMGWIVVAAYGAAAVLALAVTTGRTSPGRERAFWAVMTLGMAALAVNKQLDLQSALTATARCISQLQGWYDQRRGVQVAFVEGVAATALLVLAVALIAMRRHLGRNWVAILGLGCVLTYVAIRAAGFHDFDGPISTPAIAWIRTTPLLELTGIVLVLANAAALLLRGGPVRQAGAHRSARAHR